MNKRKRSSNSQKKKANDYVKYMMKICSKSLVIREMQNKTRDIILLLSGWQTSEVWEH